MITLKYTSTIIDPDTKKPAFSTILTKKGNKKIILLKEYIYPTKDSVKKKETDWDPAIDLGKSPKNKDISKANKLLRPRKSLPMNKDIPLKLAQHVIIERNLWDYASVLVFKNGTRWSEKAKQAHEEYRSTTARLKSEVTETYVHPNYDKDEPDRLGYYTRTRTIKREFRPLPSKKITANEKIKALIAHKAVRALEIADKKAQLVDTKELVGKILPAFDKQSYTVKLKERIANRNKITTRKDKMTMSFGNQIQKIQKKYEYFIVKNYWKHNDSDLSKDEFEDTLDAAIERANKIVEKDLYTNRITVTKGNDPTKTILYEWNKPKLLAA